MNMKPKEGEMLNKLGKLYWAFCLFVGLTAFIIGFYELNKGLGNIVSGILLLAISAVNLKKYYKNKEDK